MKEAAVTMFANKPQNTDQPKRRSLIKEAFNPHIGDSIRPVGQSFHLIVNLIAIIFANQGLFPSDHPALTGEAGAPRLHLRDVFATAWANLSFTKEGLPKVLIFFAVVASIIISVFGIFTVLMSFLVGTAHAQACPPQGCFTPAAPNTDLGYNIIDFLFGTAAQQTTAYTNINTNVYSTFAGGTLPNTNIQTALQQGLALYSGAMLIFAAIILFYHLASMVVDTAHSGVTMGKRANQVWAPIRLVAAVILLVPIAGGLNTGQLIVLKMAQWGSGLASNVWDTFKVQLAAGVNGNYASPAVPDVSDTVTNIAKMAACEYRYNYGTYQAFLADPTLTNPVGGVNPNPDEFVSGWSNSWAVGNAWNFNCDPIVPGDNSGACNNNSIGAPLQDIGASNPPLIEVTPAGTVYHFQPPRPDPTQQDICGSITIPVAPSANDITTNNLMNSVYTAQIAAFNAVLPAIMHYGSNEQQYLEGTGNAPTQGNINPDLSGQSIMNIIATYQGNLNAQIAAQVGAQAGMTDKYLGVGWMGAGAFFNQVSNIQAAIQSSSDHYIPATTPPTGDIDISDFNADLTQSIKKQSLAALPPVALPGGGGCAAGAVNNEQSFLDILKKSNGSLFDFLLDVVNLGAANTGVWCQDGTIGIRFTGSAPLNQMAAWGHQNIDLAVDIINWGGWFMVAGATASSGIIGRVVTAISAVAAGIGKVLAKFHMGSSDPSTQSQQIDSNMNAPMYANIIATANPGLASVLGEFLLPFAAIFLTLGFMFGYMLPILPFMHFLFGSVTWLTVLFEAVVAMPLVALAHINPEGEGLPGAMARNAYFMAFSILLRPVCMIFGLICGFITLMLATSLLNIFFAHAMTGNTAEGHHALVKIVYTIIYCIILISIANHAFQLISVIPDKIMSWIGAAGAKGERMGDPANIVDRSAATAAILDSKGVQQMGAMGRQARQAAVTSQQTAKSDAAAAGQRALAVDTALSARQTAANTASINSKTPP